MRNIKFRGKIVDSNYGEHALDWAYGDLVRELKTGKTFILDLSHFDITTTLSNVLLEVIPETIGQYTGFLDKVDKEIYEGDIVKAYNSSNEWSETKAVEFSNGTFTIGRYWKDGSHDWYSMEQYYEEDLEVIGNIIENNELL